MTNGVTPLRVMCHSPWKELDESHEDEDHGAEPSARQDEAKSVDDEAIGERAKQGERVVWRRHGFVISEYHVAGVLSGYGCLCKWHVDATDGPDDKCKTVCTFGKEGLSPETCILYLKRWLVMGKDITGEFARTRHSEIKRWEMAKGPSAEEIDGLIYGMA